MYKVPNEDRGKQHADRDALEGVNPLSNVMDAHLTVFVAGVV